MNDVEKAITEYSKKRRNEYYRTWRDKNREHYRKYQREYRRIKRAKKKEEKEEKQ